MFLFSFKHPFQDYFSSYETDKSVGGAKTGESHEKPPGAPTSRTWLVSHLPREGLEPTPDKQCGDRIVKYGNEISAFLTTRPLGRHKNKMHITKI